MNWCNNLDNLFISSHCYAEDPQLRALEEGKET